MVLTAFEKLIMVSLVFLQAVCAVGDGHEICVSAALFGRYPGS